MIARDLLAQWRALADAATPGAWITYRDNMRGFVVTTAVAVWPPHAPDCRAIVAESSSATDAAFIAAAGSAMVSLLDEVERMERELARTTDAHENEECAQLVERETWGGPDTALGEKLAAMMRRRIA